MANLKSEDGTSSRSQSVMDDVTTVPHIMEISWRNVVVYVYLHSAALYGLYLCFTSATMATLNWDKLLSIWSLFLYVFGGFGIAGGVHKLWCHRSFSAKLPLRVLIAVAQTIAHQDDILKWSREHRVHHKFSDTDADPYNSSRGFFFSHIGWLLYKKHPEFFRLEKTIDVSDLLQDPVVVFQQKYYYPLACIFCYAIPAVVPWYSWRESLTTAFFVASMFRYVLTLHATWFTNSAGHSWGKRPYDKQIKPSDSRLAAFFSLGERHNYHHAFPWDYRVAELGSSRMGFFVIVIDFLAWLGLIYDLKIAPERIVRGRVLRTGDGSHPFTLENTSLTSDDDIKEGICHSTTYASDLISSDKSI